MNKSSFARMTGQAILCCVMLSTRLSTPAIANNVALKAAEELKRREEVHFESLRQPRHTDSTDERNSTIRAYDDYLGQWSDAYPNFQKVTVWRNEAQNMYAAADKAKEFDDRVEQLEKDISRTQDLQERIAMIDAFLTSNLASNLPEIALAKREQVSLLRQPIIRQLDVNRWDDIIQNIRQNPTRYDDNRKTIRGFLRENPDSSFKRDAESEISMIEIAWDQSEYKKLRDLLISYQTAAPNKVPGERELNGLLSMMEDYSKRRDPEPKMKSYVNDWIRWFIALKSQSTISFNVEKVAIVRNSYLDDGMGRNRDISVQFGSTLRTSEKRTRRDKSVLFTFAFEEVLAGIPYSHPNPIELSVYCRWGAWRGFADRQVSARISAVTRSVDLLHDGNRTGTLHLSALPNQPPLPLYQTEL